MVKTAVAAAALSFYLAELKFAAWSFGKAIGCHQWTILKWLAGLRVMEAFVVLTPTLDHGPLRGAIVVSGR